MELSYITAILPALWEGLTQTVLVFLLTIALALPLGLPFALGSISRIWPIKALSKVYIWLFRGTPLLLQLSFVYFGLGIIANKYNLPFLRLDRFPAAVITFALNYAAYFAEIYRAGIQSIDHGQYEAAKSLGFSRWHTMRRIILPQTVRRIIPPVANETITLVKDTALISAIAVPELLKAARDAANRDVDTTAYFVAAAMYLLLTFALTVGSQWLEKRYSRHEREVV